MYLALPPMFLASISSHMPYWFVLLLSPSLYQNMVDLQHVLGYMIEGNVIRLRFRAISSIRTPTPYLAPRVIKILAYSCPY